MKQYEIKEVFLKHYLIIDPDSVILLTVLFAFLHSHLEFFIYLFI